jgi:hypothetical protein
MMKSVSLSKMGVILVVLCSVFLFAQGPDTLWTKTYGGSDVDYGYSVQQTTDGGYIIVGYTSSFGAGGNDVYLIKTDANGDTLWTRTYGGSDTETGWSVQQTTDGGYIIGGATNSFGAGSHDAWLIKTDANGDTLWTKTYGGSDVDYGYSVQQTTDGGYVIAGRTISFGAGSADVYLIKTDVNGDTLWTRTYGGSDIEYSGYGQSVQQSTNGGYVIIGSTKSFGAGDYDFYLIKTDANGDTLWTRTYGGSNNDYGQSVRQWIDGGYIIVGYSSSFGAGSYDVWLIKTDANGDTLWTRTYGGSGLEYGYSVQQSSDSCYIIAGSTNSFGAGYQDVYLIKTDANGDTLWTKTYGGTDWDYGWSMQQTTDGGYIIAGRTKSFGAGNHDVYLLKIEAELPAFTVTPTNITFGNVPVDSSKTDSVRVTNTGIAVLDISLVESTNPEFTVIPTIGSLAPAESMQFYITFTPTDPGVEAGNIVFTHNAASSPDTITVAGTGVTGEPEILSVVDIPDDQGRWVRVTWAASLFDRLGSPMPITQYGVWRRIDEDEKGYAHLERDNLVIAGIEDSLEGWDAIGTVPAIQDSIYNFASPTLGDSNATGIYYSVFLITAHTQDPYTWFASEPDSGYSIDNIPPETPYDLAGEVINSNVLLTWQIELNYPDFSHFAIYRDTISGFMPGAANQIGTSEVSTYTDSSLAVDTYYYVVSALDVNGNESEFSNEAEVTITGIKELKPNIPTVYALSQNHPNPFRTMTGIRYQLPKSGVVTIAIYNVSGQRIKTLVNELKDAGYYTVHWNGRSQDNQSVSNGVYFCRMVAGEYISVKKILLAR